MRVRSPGAEGVRRRVEPVEEPKEAEPEAPQEATPVEDDKPPPSSFRSRLGRGGQVTLF